MKRNAEAIANESPGESISTDTDAILGKHEVHIIAVEVSTTDEAFEMKIISCVWHSIKFIFYVKVSTLW